MTATALTPALALQLTQLLLARESELRGMLHAATEQAVHASERPAEPTDFKKAAAGQLEATVEDRTTALAAQELQQVVAALRRLEQGTYGECLDCGEPIDERRLLALPATPLCASCQAAHEKEARGAAAPGPWTRRP